MFLTLVNPSSQTPGTIVIVLNNNDNSVYYNDCSLPFNCQSYCTSRYINEKEGTARGKYLDHTDIQRLPFCAEASTTQYLKSKHRNHGRNKL